MNIKKYTLYFFNSKTNIFIPVPNTGIMSKQEANTIAKELRTAIENINKRQVAVFRGTEMRSCFGFSENLKPLISI